MVLQKQITRLDKRIKKLQQVIEPYKEQLNALYEERNAARVTLFLEAHGLKIGDKLIVSASLNEQQRVYGWGAGAWPIGSIATVDGVAFSDGDRGGDEIAVRFGDSRTITPPWVVFEMRQDYVATFGEEE